jgi:HAE1 family hydrophobic/amphiphilic exporter-1
MKEISGPVIAIALILAAVFVPVSFVPGIVGRLYQQFAITIAVSVLLSAFVALSLTPALCAMMLKPTKGADEKKNLLEKFFAMFNAWFDKVSHSYTRGVSKWIKGTPYVIIMMVCLIVGLTYLFKTKPSGFIPVEDEGRLFVTYEMQEATSTTRNIEMIKDIMKRVSAILKSKRLVDLRGLTLSVSRTRPT